MKAAAVRFPSLAANADLAEVQVRQTLAMGLVPLGISLLLMAAMAPDWPAPGLWVGAGLALGGMALIWVFWRWSGRRHLRGFSTTHFLVRYLFIVLCPALLWIVFGEAALESSGWIPPALLGTVLVLYPVGRLVQERVDPDPRQTPRLERTRIVIRLLQISLGILALAVLLTGSVLGVHEDHPTEPTPILLLLWLVALLAVLAFAVLAAAGWQRVETRSEPSPPLDDEPPSAPPAAPLSFGSDRF